jgi:hypothetical protein
MGFIRNYSVTKPTWISVYLCKNLFLMHYPHEVSLVKVTLVQVHETRIQ